MSYRLPSRRQQILLLLWQLEQLLDLGEPVVIVLDDESDLVLRQAPVHHDIVLVSDQHFTGDNPWPRDRQALAALAKCIDDGLLTSNFDAAGQLIIPPPAR